MFIATDLEIVLFESLTAPSIPSRLASLASSASASQRGSASQRTEGDIVKQAERVLHQLEREVMRPGRTWVESEVVVSEHAFYVSYWAAAPQCARLTRRTAWSRSLPASFTGSST